jgi:tetratricopeptide (TPR) repeat protein
MVDEAIAAGEEAVDLAPDYAQGRNNLAVAYHNQGRVDEAIAQWEEAIRLDPEHAGALENVARAYGQEARWPEAVEAYEAYLAIEPSDDGAYTNLGIAYAEVGRMEDAVGAWQAAIEANPSAPNPHKNLGLVYGQQGEVEEAIVEFQTYVELAPDAPDREAIEQNIATLQAQAAASWTEARNTAGGYALSYPQDWYRLDNDIQTALSPTQADYEAETLQAPLITCFAWPLDRAADSFDLDDDAGPEDYLPVLAERLEAEIGPLQTGTVDGYAAALAPTSGTLRGTAFRGTLVMVRVEERLLIVDAVAPSGQWDAFSPLFRQMLDSVSFFVPDR